MKYIWQDRFFHIDDRGEFAAADWWAYLAFGAMLTAEFIWDGLDELRKG